MPQASGENRCGGRGGSPDGRGLALAVCVSASGWRGSCTAGDVTAAGANRGCGQRLGMCGPRGGVCPAAELGLAMCPAWATGAGAASAATVTAADAGCGCRARNMDRLTERAGCEQSDRPQAGVCQAGRTFRTLAVRPARYRGK